MKKIKTAFIIFIMLTFVASYSHALVGPRGTDDTFDLLTWNIHNFPGTGFRTIDTLAVLINDLDVDIIAFQEIADTIAFGTLMNQLPGWDGIYSTDEYSWGDYQKTGVIWRTDRASVTYVEALFENNWYQFPRPPMHVAGNITFGEHQFDFHLIVLHLKAGSTDDDRLRRRAAVIMLKSYLDNNVPGGDDEDWIVLGDWNDELEDPQSVNVFWPLLEDSTDYTFLTLPLAGNPYWASYPSWPSMIDHIMITSDAMNEYGDGTTITLRLDDEYSNYAYRISDHRPVMAQFAGAITAINDEDSQAFPDELTTLDIYPNPFNNSANLRLSLSGDTNLKLEIYDILGRKVETAADGYFYQGDYSFAIDGSNWESGVYFARIITEYIQISRKLILLK